MFKKLLIANRGEIACRIISTARKLNIKTVAIYSNADCNAQHVQLADEAYCVGEAASRESYLSSDKILNIATQCKADAIHPGYGFLSENAEFAALCAEHHIQFIGPDPQAIRAMANKDQAKQLMRQANIPVIPGFDDTYQSIDDLLKAAKKIGFPILIKAAAGGGGKGMRIVHTANEFKAAVESAQREARNHFKDDKLILEKYFPHARHIEVQIIGDNQANIIHLFTRDCSIQRRYQKIIEEAPASLAEPVREKIQQTAIQAAKAIEYRNAGTIEFLVDEKENFYFMEMNTRLQVEHPVTEMITDIDLVEWQLKVAAGETFDELKNHSCSGHAIEVRLYAEDPTQNFLPACGKIKQLRWPQLAHVRIDSALRADDVITMDYDPMIAKIIAWGKDRHEAIHRLSFALAQTFVVGIATNLNFLQQLLQQNTFIDNKLITTQFLEHFSYQLITLPSWIYALAAVIIGQQRLNAFPTPENDPYSPWHYHNGWQLNFAYQQQCRFQHEDSIVNLLLEQTSHDVKVFFNQENWQFKNICLEAETIDVEMDGHTIQANYLLTQELLIISVDHQQYMLPIYQSNHNNHAHEADQHSVTPPMPGTITAIHVKPKQTVNVGEALITIEAMKMEHTLKSPQQGVISKILCAIGDRVDENTTLIEFDSDS